MQTAAQSDEKVVESARRVLAARGKFRWLMLCYAVVFLGMCAWFTLAGIRKIEDMETERLGMGFVYGVALAVVWMSFGVLGGLCLGKFLAGVSADFRLQELVVCYHDRLRELGQLPDDKKGNPPKQQADSSGS